MASTAVEVSPKVLFCDLDKSDVNNSTSTFSEAKEDDKEAVIKEEVIKEEVVEEEEFEDAQFETLLAQLGNGNTFLRQSAVREAEATNQLKKSAEQIDLNQ
jgi:hypothetical protein